MVNEIHESRCGVNRRHPWMLLAWVVRVQIFIEDRMWTTPRVCVFVVMVLHMLNMLLRAAIVYFVCVGLVCDGLTIQSVESEGKYVTSFVIAMLWILRETSWLSTERHDLELLIFLRNGKTKKDYERWCEDQIRGMVF